MNWIILYIISFLLIIAVLGFGVLINSQARVCFHGHKDEQNSKGLMGKEFSEKLFAHNKLRNISFVTLNAKKTNYYSAKYNVIKVAPGVAESSFLFDLALCAKCTNQATKQQYNYITATLKLLLSAFVKFMYIAFIPIVLICSILNITLGLEKISFIIVLVSIICYALAFIIQIIMHFIDQSTVNKITKNIEKLELFDEKELKTLEILISTLNKFEFFETTRLSLRLFTFMSPGTIFDKNQR